MTTEEKKEKNIDKTMHKVIGMVVVGMNLGPIWGDVLTRQAPLLQKSAAIAGLTVATLVSYEIYDFIANKTINYLNRKYPDDDKNNNNNNDVDLSSKIKSNRDNYISNSNDQINSLKPKL